MTTAAASSPTAPAAPAAPLPARAARIRNLALAALVGAVGVEAVLVGFGPARVLGLEVPGAVTLALLAASLLVGAAAATRRSLPLLAVALAALLAPALAERGWEATPGRLVGSLALGFLALAFGELVHMTTRYEKWARAGDAQGASVPGLDHAVDEYLRTFFRVMAIAAAFAALVAGVQLAILRFGPAQLAASLDFRSFYGLIGAAALVFGAVGLYALARGADWSRPGARSGGKQPATRGDEIVISHSNQVVAPDGPE